MDVDSELHVTSCSDCTIQAQHRKLKTALMQGKIIVTSQGKQSHISAHHISTVLADVIGLMDLDIPCRPLHCHLLQIL